MKTTPAAILTALLLTASASPLRAATSASPATPPATNGPAGPEPVHLTSTLVREIKLTEDGASATYGLTKVFWKSDLAAEKPIRMITPDNRTIYARPAFLILRNRALDQSLLLGSVTNRIGEISQDSVIWTNVLDAGPNISIEYRYLGNRGVGLEQNVICLESPDIPSGWTNSDVALEFWTEWIDSAPSASETRTIALRAESISLPEVQADDQQISFGPVSKLVAGGRSFTVGEESDSLPVAKTWASVAPTNGAPARTFVIEELDWSAASSQLRALPPTSRRASLSRPKSSRSALLQAALGSEPSRFETARSSRSKFLVSSASTPGRSAFNSSRFASSPSVPQRGFVVDWTLLNGIPLPANAVGWWPAGGNVTDATTNHNDGTEIDYIYVAGKVGQCFSFIEGAGVRVPDSPSLHLTNAMTAECWIYSDGQAYPGSLMSKWDSAVSQRSFDLTFNTDGTLKFTVSSNGLSSGTGYVQSAASAPFSEWTHIAATYDGSALKLYINGNLDTSNAYTKGIFAGTNDFALGGGSVAAPFLGQIDEAALYRRALSPGEILAIYNAGPAGKYSPNCVAASTNAVGWWPGDGNGYDLARTNFGTLYSGTTYSSAQVGQGFDVPGGAAHFRIEHSPDLRLTNALTAEGWIFSTDQSDYRSIISKWVATIDSDQRCWDLAIVPWDGTLRFLVTSNGLDAGGVDISSADPVPMNEWIHVAGTYNGSYLRVYINGVLEGEAAYTKNIFPGTNNLTVSGYTGGRPPGSGIVYSPFLGIIDEPTVYNRALSDVEIAAIYSAGSAGKCKVDADLDGLTTIQEAWLGTSDANPDYDNDGVLDGIELFQGRQPKAAGGIVDTNQLIKLEVFTPLK